MPKLSHRMTAVELCTRTVVMIDRHATLPRAARLMREQHVGCLVVVDESPEGHRVAGILTDRDIVTAVVAREVDASSLRVADVMVVDVVCVGEDDSLHDVLGTMRRCHVRRVPVIGLRQRLVGMLSVDDVLRAMADELHTLSAVLDEQVDSERLARP